MPQPPAHVTPQFQTAYGTDSKQATRSAGGGGVQIVHGTSGSQTAHGPKVDQLDQGANGGQMDLNSCGGWPVPCAYSCQAMYNTVQAVCSARGRNTMCGARAS